LAARLHDSNDSMAMYKVLSEAVNLLSTHGLTVAGQLVFVARAKTMLVP